MSGVSGNKTSTLHGGSDWWVLRLASNGTILWDRTFGGAQNATFPSIPANDSLHAITDTTDGGFLLVGSSYSSTGGSKTSSGFGGWDAYWMKIDGNGNLLWDKTFGTSRNEGTQGACNTSDGGYAFVGTFNQSGNNDVWVIKTDSAGNVQWEQTYGGSGDDAGVSIIQRSDGGYIVAAASASGPSAGKTSPYYGGAYYLGAVAGDYWILWIDAHGTKHAERSFGGEHDEMVVGMASTADGGILVSGTSLSPANGNKTSAGIGYTDTWVVRLDSSGNKLWERSYGGPWWDYARTLHVLDDGGFLLGGQMNAKPWLVRCDKHGAPLWQQSDEWMAMESVDSVALAADGALFFVGSAWSASSGFGKDDFVVVRTSPEPPVLSVVPTDLNQGFVLDVFSAPGTCVSEWSTNAIDWMAFSTNVSMGKVFQVTDPAGANASRKFYRVGRY